jgi:hypothetical protein
MLHFDEFKKFLQHNRSWSSPQKDVLNDRQYTTSRLSALGLFSDLTLPIQQLPAIS